ncbi:MAG: ATP-dependent Clp protease ATP-binding subunit ClpX [Deltaproteobacteria bacterium]|nr:ATP-dependent Clp protease ATP-binding subunit ClpX [Deltaproteobacteria bacterium]MCB9786030.1 ATP-dependent Clp protease ATP-binding subunit ClpX [Deltaproteobacteria bacterium]
MHAFARRLPDTLSPRAIFEHLDRFVIGQERAKRALAIAAYNHMRRVGLRGAPRPAASAGLLKKSNVLLIGPTGCGKTHLARHLATALDVPFAVVDATEYTEAGYHGRDVEQMVTELLLAADQDAEACGRGIIFIDEVDKIARRTHGAHTGAGARDIGGEGVQQSLLKLLEGREVFVPLSHAQGFARQDFVTVDTTDILFICAGTFSDLRPAPGEERALGFNRRACGEGAPAARIGARELCEFGMLAEFVGRLPVIVELEPLGEDEMLEILTTPPDSIVREFRERLALDGVAVEFETAALRRVVEHANRRGLGARALRGILEEVMGDVMFRAPELDDDRLLIDEAFVVEQLAALSG